MIGTIVRIVLELGGSIAIFLYGMQLCSDGIQRAAGDRLQKTVNFMTSNRLMGVLTGALVTVLIQSSSATTVMVVSFVNAGLLSLTQAIGVIMGANVGTTLTGWIIAAVGVGKFDILTLAVPLFGLGFFLSLLRRRSANLRPLGETLMGFAIIFLGLNFLSHSIPAPGGDALLFLQNLAGSGWLAIILCVLAGMVFTVLVSASSATQAIAIGMAIKGVISFEMAAALTLGANIGTTFNGFLVSLRSNTMAKRAAWAHILFNLFGSLWVLAVFRPFLSLVDWITPGALSEATVAVHLAMFHTVFNIANTVVLFPFVRHYAALVSGMIRQKPGELCARSVLHYSAPLMGTPELNLVSARKEISDMAGVARGLFSRFVADARQAPQDMEAELRWFTAESAYLNSMRDGLSRFLLETMSHDPAERTQENIHHLLRVVNELDNIAGSCMNLVYLLEKRERKGLEPSKGELAGLEPYYEVALEFMQFIEENASKPISESQLDLATDMENRLDRFRDDLRKKARKRMSAGSDIKAELLYIDMVRHIEKIGDFSFAIAGALRALR